MQRKELTAQNRKDFKKGASRRLRKMGRIPAIVYGHRDPAAISIDEREFHKQFHTVSENTLIKLSTEDDSYDVLVKDYQEDILSGKIVHIDFYEIERGKVLRTNIPVHTEGSAPGVREGGILDLRLHEIEVECMPENIPEVFTVDVSTLSIGDAVHVSDLEAPEGVTFLNNEDQVIVSITHAKMELELPEEEVEEEGVEAEEGAEAEQETEIEEG